MKYPAIFTLLIAVAALCWPEVRAQGISAEGTAQDGLTAEGDTYNGTGTVQDSAADGDIKVIDVLESDAEVKEEKEKQERGPEKRK